MADWKTISRLGKQQHFKYTGAKTQNLQDLFNGTGLTSGQVFNLNQGIIFSSVSCDFSTNWQTSGNNVVVSSKMDTWLPTMKEFLVDLDNAQAYPLYKNGINYTITIPSGNIYYTIEVTTVGDGPFTVFENDIPHQVEGIQGGSIIKYVRRYYNQTATTTSIRLGTTNIKFAHMSACYYFEKNSRDITNVAIVAENIYSDPSIGGGVVIPPGVDPGEEDPDLYEVIGRLEIAPKDDTNTMIFDFNEWAICDRDGSNERPVVRYNDVNWLSLREQLITASWPTVSNPDIMPWNRFANYGVMDVNVSPYIKEINFGYKKNAVTHFRNMEEFDYIRAYVNQNVNSILVNVWTKDGGPLYNNKGALSLQKAPGTGAELINIIYKKVDDE